MNVYNAGPTEKTVKRTVFMKHISSDEGFKYPSGASVRILQDVNLTMGRAEAWAVSARTAAEVRLLLEVVANIRPYRDGVCILAERGMMRRKRVILPHVFYIGGADMLYPNMNVLEYLMFALGRFKTARVLLQDELFEFLLDAGLGYISLTKTGVLTPEEKAVTALVAASWSDSLIVVFNLPEYPLGAALTDAVVIISRKMRQNGQTLVIGTNDALLTEKACSHAAFLADGRMIYQGGIETLRWEYDPVELILTGGNLPLLAQRLTSALPQFEVELKNGSLRILNREGIGYPDGYLHCKIIEAQAVPESIEVNPKTVKNAWEELLRRHDLQNKHLQEGAAPGLQRG